MKFSSPLLFGLFFLTILSSCSIFNKQKPTPVPDDKTATIPPPINTENELAQLIKYSSVFSKSFTGFSLYDPSTKEYIYQENGDKYFTPASNTKLFTFYTCLEVLGDSIPALKYVIQGDSLIFWGTGDPSFLNPNLPHDTKIIKFLTNRKEKLFFCSHNFQDKKYGSGWAWDDYPYYFQPEKSPLPIHGNVVSFHQDRNTDNFNYYPHFFYDFLKKDRNHRTVSRHPDKNIFYYNPRSRAGFSKQIPFIYSDSLLINGLNRLFKLNIQLYTKKEMPPKHHKIVYSVPSDLLYKRLLQPSDNFVAEQLMLLCGAVINDTLNVRKTIDFAKHNFFNNAPSILEWVDASGLSRYNLITPNTLVYLLEKIYHKIPMERIKEVFPAGGQSGTIRRWYASDPPFIYAKTGTLRHRHTLSGYLITESKRVLIFSFMHNNYVSPSSEIKREMDKVLRHIQKSY